MRTRNILATLPVLAFTGCVDEPNIPEVDTVNCTLATYRIVTADVPLTPQLARDASIDLDGDTIPDNAGGGLLGAFYAEFGAAASLPELVNERLISEEVPWFIALNQCEDGRYLFWTLRGEDRNGDGVYELSDRGAPPAQGFQVGSPIEVRDGGFGAIPIGIFADPLGEAGDIWSSGAGLAASFTMEDGTLEGKLGLGLADNYFETIGRPLAAFFTSRLQAGTSEIAASFDQNGDGTVSLAELEESALIKATLLNPDLDLLSNGAYDPGRDQIDDSLSFGFSFRAEPVNVRWQ